MKKTLLSIAVMLLTSCVSFQYGNFTNITPSVTDVMATDTVEQLTRNYPPAQNRFCFKQKITDHFGVKLVSLMRQKGYGIIEIASLCQQPSFYYVVDELKANHLYRVSVFVGPQSLSRAYWVQKGIVVPQSAWSYKE